MASGAQRGTCSTAKPRRREVPPLASGGWAVSVTASMGCMCCKPGRATTGCFSLALPSLSSSWSAVRNPRTVPSHHDIRGGFAETWFRREKPIIVGFPFQNLKFYHKRKKPISLDAINQHRVIPGKSGVGKSVLAYALWTRDVDEGRGAHSLFLRTQDPAPQVRSQGGHSPNTFARGRTGRWPAQRSFRVTRAAIPSGVPRFGSGCMTAWSSGWSDWSSAGRNPNRPWNS